MIECCCLVIMPSVDNAKYLLIIIFNRVVFPEFLGIRWIPNRPNSAALLKLLTAD